MTAHESPKSGQLWGVLVVGLLTMLSSGGTLANGASGWQLAASGVALAGAIVLTTFTSAALVRRHRRRSRN